VAEVRIGSDVYGLTDSSLDELTRRVRDAEPPDHDESEAAQSLERKLVAAAETGAPVEPDPAELALLGVVIEAWAVELGTDAADVESLREAIADALG
jgi:hypothetical protein